MTAKSATQLRLIQISYYKISKKHMEIYSHMRDYLYEFKIRDPFFVPPVSSDYENLIDAYNAMLYKMNANISYYEETFIPLMPKEAGIIETNKLALDFESFRSLLKEIDFYMNNYDRLFELMRQVFETLPEIYSGDSDLKTLHTMRTELGQLLEDRAQRGTTISKIFLEKARAYYLFQYEHFGGFGKEGYWFTQLDKLFADIEVEMILAQES